MKIEVLVAALEKNPEELAEKMNIRTDCLIVNQCDRNGFDEFSRNGHTVRVLSMTDRGVGISRNAAIDNSKGDILLFSDQDIVYNDDYESVIEEEFNLNPGADMLVFNIGIDESRKTFENTDRNRVHFFNSGRYGAVSFAIKKDALIKSGIKFSLLFGGGAKYSAGEDSLFIFELLKKGVKIYKAIGYLGKEDSSESTWFKGYNEKYFFDRGVLYDFLYGIMAKPFAVRFLKAHSNTLLSEMSFNEAYRIMKSGIKQGRIEKERVS